MFATLEKQLAWAHIGTMAAHISVHRLAKLLCVGMNSTHSPTTTHQARVLKGMRKALNIDIYVLSKFGDPSWKSRYQQLLWDGDPDPPYSTRRTKSIFSDFCQPRRWWTVWKTISRTVWFSRPRSFESQPWNCFVVKWNSLLSEGRVDNSSDQFFTRGVGWNDYLVPGMYVKTLL